MTITMNTFLWKSISLHDYKAYTFHFLLFHIVFFYFNKSKSSMFSLCQILRKNVTRPGQLWNELHEI